jgi:hypothetical protein
MEECGFRIWVKFLWLRQKSYKLLNSKIFKGERRFLILLPPMKLFPGSLLFVLLLAMGGCKQDFDNTSKYKEVTVVYGLLNKDSTTHYIRIQKGYLIDGNAEVAAGIYDSIYYRNVLAVKMTPYLNGVQSGSPFTLTRVNGNDVGLPKESGTFASDSNILYRFTGTLNQDKSYKLEITNNESGALIHSETTLVKDFQINTPGKGVKLNLQSTSPAKVVFSPAENAGIYDLTVRFYYKEFSQADNSLLKDTFADIVLFRSLMVDYSTNNIVSELSANAVLGFLSSHLEHNNAVYREFNVQKGMRVIISAGGTELAKYLTSAIAQGGLASNEALPVYTDIQGGQGLFSSRYIKQVDSVLLSDRGLDSLACSDLAQGLRFKNHSGQICN